jgi:hypothetical protein
MPSEAERDMPPSQSGEQQGGGLGVPDASQMLRGIFGR